MSKCKSIGCERITEPHDDFCVFCKNGVEAKRAEDFPANKSMSELYPAYFKDVSELDEIDVYAVHHLFQVQDCAGILQHSSKKILLSGVRTGNKTKYKDIKEARDSLNRWLQINDKLKHME